MERNSTKERHAQLGRFFFGTTMTENIGALTAMRADKGAHVFDNPEDRHIHVLKHFEAFAGINQRQILRGGNDNRTGNRHLLGQCELGVTCARRHVEHQNVERAPRHFAQHLHQGRNHHRAAPDHGVIFFHQEAHRHHLDAVFIHRV